MIIIITAFIPGQSTWGGTWYTEATTVIIIITAFTPGQSTWGGTRYIEATTVIIIITAFTPGKSMWGGTRYIKVTTVIIISPTSSISSLAENPRCFSNRLQKNINKIDLFHLPQN